MHVLLSYLTVVSVGCCWIDTTLPALQGYREIHPRTHSPTHSIIYFSPVHSLSLALSPAITIFPIFLLFSVDSYVLLTWPSGSNCIYIGTAVSEVRSINITRPLESNTASYEQSTASSCEQSILASHRALPGQQQQQLPRESFTLPIYYRNDVFGGR